MSAATTDGVTWDRERFVAMITDGVATWRWRTGELGRMRARVHDLAGLLDDVEGRSAQDRWDRFETSIWPGWIAGCDRPGRDLWRWGTWGAVLTRVVQPSWPFMSSGRIGQWSARLAADDPLRVEAQRLDDLLAGLHWVSATAREHGRCIALRLLVVHGLTRLDELTDDHLRIIGAAKGMDALDGALCAGGILDRTPMRSASRWTRRERLSPSELVDIAKVPDRFRDVTILYLDEYVVRLAPAYRTLRGRAIALGHWWRYLGTMHPGIGSCSDVRARHARGFVAWAKEHAEAVRRRSAHDVGTHERMTAHHWAGEVKVFFADLTSWASDEDSPLAGLAPPLNPLGRRDLASLEPRKIKRQTQARIEATVLELERELPKIRAYALRRWRKTADGDEQQRHPPRQRERGDLSVLGLGPPGASGALRRAYRRGVRAHDA